MVVYVVSGSSRGLGGSGGGGGAKLWRRVVFGLHHVIRFAKEVGVKFLINHFFVLSIECVTE